MMEYPPICNFVDHDNLQLRSIICTCCYLQGVLRGAMLTFFASASDFTRRLTSVEANAKFSRLDAGPEEDWEATAADLRGVVVNIKQRYTRLSSVVSSAC